MIDSFKLIHGNCIEKMREMPAESADSIVTDPPYGLAFMGKSWDHAVPGVEYWAECLRVLKPGGHLAAFGGTRLYHRMACAIEDSGFEIRDCLMWVYGTGFPKSHDVSKAIDKAVGAERPILATIPDRWAVKGNVLCRANQREADQVSLTAPATPDAVKWQGWGTALKPAWEPIVLARKPFKGPVASNVLEHGTGAINIDGCRVGNDAIFQHGRSKDDFGFTSPEPAGRTWSGRWPANLVHDGSPLVVDELPTRAARFFYCAKASQAERNAGLDELPTGQTTGGGGMNNPDAGRIYGSMQTPQKNIHPTVKPIALMRWLCRMITPPLGIVLDPFCGSGSTIVAAMQEGFRGIGIEMDENYIQIARARCEHEDF